MPGISSRGLSSYLREAEKCLRLGPVRDRTNGFFVACFQRGASEQPPTTGDDADDNENEVVDVEVEIVLSDNHSDIEDVYADTEKGIVARVKHNKKEMTEKETKENEIKNSKSENKTKSSQLTKSKAVSTNKTGRKAKKRNHKNTLDMVNGVSKTGFKADCKKS